MSNIEAKSKIAFEAIIRNPSIATVSENKIVLADFFVFQESRTPVFRKEYISMVQGTNSKLKKHGLAFSIPTENKVKQFQTHFLIEDTPVFSRILLEMKWVLVLNQTDTPFCTSDNPIIRFNPHKSDLVSNLGLISSGIQLHFPLSPKLVLLICDPHEYGKLGSELMATPPNVDFNNSGQVINSRQYLFSIDDNFKLAKAMLRKYPEFKDPNRSRVVVT